ncbi:hypothetical protein EVAR_4994_1 [Eumeta japonica]|uniref:Uncharacterized protein n=1 Tax=Eumeta variegata TaxID=151549 RepID=A0A4C1UZ69_EUMVA|nr:hypothetical protein EVAR_4994_1 [Eumeta japonica]
MRYVNAEEQPAAADIAIIKVRRRLSDARRRAAGLVKLLSPSPSSRAGREGDDSTAVRSTSERWRRSGKEWRKRGTS